MPDKPPIPLTPSATDRHELLRITPKTWVKHRTSIALPGIDTRAEIEMIDRGYGQRVGDSRYAINGRTYVHKPDGATYPEDGEGIVTLTNPQLRALRLLIEHDGRTVGFNRASGRDPTISEVDIDVALELFRIRKGE